MSPEYNSIYDYYNDEIMITSDGKYYNINIVKERAINTPQKPKINPDEFFNLRSML